MGDLGELLLRDTEPANCPEEKMCITAWELTLRKL